MKNKGGGIAIPNEFDRKLEQPYAFNDSSYVFPSFSVVQ